ncbi:hypothetical protein J7E93_00585 [Streptomyces sp. ISL-36]|uniref:hypothetical protein n=1 Tax=Streptomyces sp. ISL-36 TaxID=2819182 RepID=UPI001BEBF690|nr:hypothetical protein [Streptomyces sp. ISL-36]MBT2438646.1 hypothetical protein [Streptomyces sp. ISL-36]
MEDVEQAGSGGGLLVAIRLRGGLGLLLPGGEFLVVEVRVGAFSSSWSCWRTSRVALADPRTAAVVLPVTAELVLAAN